MSASDLPTRFRRKARTLARRSALDALSLSTLSQAGARSLGRERVHFLYLHDLPPHEEPKFRDLVRSLQQEHVIIGHTEAVERIKTGRIDRPFASISFDDGFVSNLRAAQILEEQGATGAFFVPTQFIGCSDLAQARTFFRTHEGVNEPAMTWNDLEQLKARGHEIGNHTRTHPNLADCSPQQIADEIEGANEELQLRLGIERPHFAWPLGRFKHATSAVADTAQEVASSCASAERGAHVVPPQGDAPLCLRREHVLTTWPLRHVRYFMTRSARAASALDNNFPMEWTH